MADLTNGIDQINTGPPVGPPALNEFFFGREYQSDSDWFSAAPGGSVSFSNVYVAPENASITSLVIPMTNVTSGQPIIVALMGSPNGVYSYSFSDNFTGHYTWTSIGTQQFLSIGSGTNRALLQLWIGTGGTGSQGIVTISGLNNNAGGPYGAMAYSAKGASTAPGLAAVDIFGFNNGLSSTPSAPNVSPSVKGGGILGFVFIGAGGAAGRNIGAPMGPVGWENDALPQSTLWTPPNGYGGAAGTLSNVQTGTVNQFSWSGPWSDSWVAGAVVLLPFGYVKPDQSVDLSAPTGIPSETLPPIGPPPLTAFLFAPPLPTEMGPSAPAHVPNTQASVTPALAGPPIGEMFPPLGPPPINAFLFGRDTSTGDSGFSPNTWIGVASVTSGNLNISATSQRTAFANSSVTFGNLNVSATSQKTVSGNASVPISSLSVTATSQVTVVSVSSVAIGNLSVVAASRHTVTGSAAVTAGNLTITAHGFKTATGSSSVTLGSLTASAIGARAATGFSSISIGTLSITATGTTFRTHPGRILSSIIPKGSITTSVEMKGSITARVVPKGTITTSVEL